MSSMQVPGRRARERGTGRRGCGIRYGAAALLAALPLLLAGCGHPYYDAGYSGGAVGDVEPVPLTPQQREITYGTPGAIGATDRITNPASSNVVTNPNPPASGVINSSRGTVEQRTGR